MRCKVCRLRQLSGPWTQHLALPELGAYGLPCTDLQSLIAFTPELAQAPPAVDWADILMIHSWSNSHQLGLLAQGIQGVRFKRVIMDEKETDRSPNPTPREGVKRLVMCSGKVQPSCPSTPRPKLLMQALLMLTQPMRGL